MNDCITEKDQIIQIVRALVEILDNEVIGSGEILKLAIKTRVEKLDTNTENSQELIDLIGKIEVMTNGIKERIIADFIVELIEVLYGDTLDFSETPKLYNEILDVIKKIN